MRPMWVGHAVAERVRCCHVSGYGGIFMNVARRIALSGLAVTLAATGLLLGTASPASAGLGDGAIEIIAPAQGGRVAVDTPVDVVMTLTPDLDPGTYVLGATGLLAREFTISAADVEAGRMTVSGSVFGSPGYAYVSVTRTDPASTPSQRVFDQVGFSVVEPRADITPADDSGRSIGSTGPVSVRLWDAPAGDYSVNVRSERDPQDYSLRRVIAHNGAVDRTYTFDVPAFSVQGAHRITVRSSAGTVLGESLFEVYEVVDATPVRHRWAPGTFYPLVRDRYRDTTNIAYRLSMPATEVVVHVVNASGKSVRVADFGREPQGTRTWEWNGKNNSGETVRPGDYSIEVYVQDASGHGDTVSRDVEVVTDTVTKRAYRSQKGTWTSSRSTAGNCFIHGYAGSLRLDCWAGHHAQATWTFRVPESADGFRLSFRGDVGCCEDGQLLRTGRLVRPGAYRATVRVTNWRAFTVDDVLLSYRYEKRR